MPLVRSKHEKGFNSSSSLQVPKVVFVGYKMEISSFLSVAMAATSTSNPRGPSFSTSGLKTFFFTQSWHAQSICVYYVGKYTGFQKWFVFVGLEMEIFFFFFFYYSTCLQPPAEVLPKGWSFNLRPQDKKSSKAQKSISCMCLLHTQKKCCQHGLVFSDGCLQKVVQSLWSERLYRSLDIFKLCASCCCHEKPV